MVHVQSGRLYTGRLRGGFRLQPGRGFTGQVRTPLLVLSAFPVAMQESV